MHILFGLICIGFGAWAAADPVTALKFEDMFRITGKRQYSEFAILMTRFGGIVGVILGIILLFSPGMFA